MTAVFRYSPILLFLVHASAALASGGVGSPSLGLSCGAPDSRASQVVIDAFVKDPSSILSRSAVSANGGFSELATTVRSLADAQPATAGTLVAVAATADDSQKSAIGQGLRAAADDCASNPTTETIGFEIQRIVALSSNMPLVLAFAGMGEGEMPLPPDCKVKPEVATKAEVDDFMKDPPSLFKVESESKAKRDPSIRPDAAIARKVRNLVVTSTATLLPITVLARSATPPQRALIGLGLAQAALMCGSDGSTAIIGLRIQQAVAKLNDPTMMSAFLAGTNQIETTALRYAGGGGGGGGAAGPAAAAAITSSGSPLANYSVGSAGPGASGGGAAGYYGGGSSFVGGNTYISQTDVSPTQIIP